jgi:hypothetical protein
MMGTNAPEAVMANSVGKGSDCGLGDCSVGEGEVLGEGVGDDDGLGLIGFIVGVGEGEGDIFVVGIGKTSVKSGALGIEIERISG